ncbi:MAG TPA: sugar ABC transporter ATP-binding protein [Clostridiales bacterium]|nr:sugar ABC transporter ATP-binding protein [Clostridiales bacterium]
MKVLTRRKILKFVTYILITIGAILMILPFLWMISTSFKNPLKVYELPIKWIPETFNIKNYTRLFTEYNFSLYIFNSLKLAALNIIGNVLSCSLVAYGFSFLRHRYKNKIFVLLLATMMLPGAVTFFPQFILFNHIGWYGTTLPLWVPSFCGSAFYIFLLRQFFLTIPSELIDAAKMDGCSDLKILFKIVLPMSKPALMVIVIYTFIDVWNDFFGPLIYIIREEQRTVAVALNYLNSTYEGTSSIPITMAASVLLIIPSLVIYFAGQSHISKGIVFKGVEK